MFFFSGAALLLYAVLSSPTPDGFTAVELVMALLLIGAFGAKVAAKETLNFSVFLVFLVTLFLGLISARDIGAQFVRDLIAHVFLFVPVLVFSGIHCERSFGRFVDFLALCGGIISFRYLMITGFSFGGFSSGESYTFDGFLKLNTDPLVTLAGSMFLYQLARFINKKTLFNAVVGVGGLLAFFSVGSSGLRGPIAIVLVSNLLFLYTNRRSPLVIVIAMLIFSVLVVYASSYLSVMYDIFIDKMERAGSNEKLREFVHVFSTAHGGVDVLLGDGFGAIVDLGGRSLAFTHSAASYYYAKTGIFGSVAIVIYLFIASRSILQAMPLYLSFPFVAISFYGFWLNPHYKYLSLGYIFIAMMYAKSGRKGR